ncbi:MAG: endolytic transglycosylase MltG [Rhodothermales bacterium]
MAKKLIGLGLLLVLGGAVAAGAGYWMLQSPNTPDFEGERSVKIPRGASFESVVDTLGAQGLLKRPRTFELVAQLTGWGNQIKAGHYVFESGTSNYTFLDRLRKGLQDPIRLTVPPGTRPEVVARVLAKQMTFTPEAFMAALNDPTFAAELDTDTTHLFGYMMPETYFMYWLTDERSVISKIKRTTDDYFDAERRAKAERAGLTVDEVLNVASIVEWETSLRDEKAKVAGVYLNRLRDGWKLDADPTVQYAVLQQEGAKRRLFFRDYRIEHPYNTYLRRGLPPGPVTNPSPSSIDGVLDAEDHGYYFFVATGDGGHTFSRTLSEHNRAAQAFYRTMRERRRQAAAAQTP